MTALHKAVEAGALSDKRAGIAEAALTESALPGVKASSAFRLKGVSLAVPPGSLVAVVGAVGAGKSALLSAILGEMEIEHHGPAVTVRGRVAYAAQAPFIVSATIKDNILFGLPFDAVLYARAIDGCCLGPDLATFRGGDAIEIGEAGINISGGQRQRLSLARAIYSALMGEADILLLDDVLSAVDAHVGAHIIQQCILKMFHRRKTVVLVTHSLACLPSCDQVLLAVLPWAMLSFG